ncbi:conserved protein of unknown function [Candidatus Hydrogenisulfobacillus filiaventi]|uniref:GatB/YqeY domain-containing protein n=1 Tax=Candidatus Hydrogenisulfobacillus filiaventi TaxID=2707344 RepID=A0A6F8ZIC2_9FIRM|nr:GatB/YqeY domain-containing protein [Bacillota bacterium]CAB1129629.1 conserved protein of unknown function [Candidatus Hydrogenisulfobacillus filiaventi]
MGLRERLDEDLKAALRAKDQRRLAVIRGVKAAILAEETKGTRTSLDDDGIVGVLSKEIKQRRDAIPDFRRGNRPDLVEQAEAEIAILEEYLPAPLSPAELEALVEEAVAETGASGPRDMGKVMGWLRPRTRGRADGKAVADLVKARLGG